MCLGPNSSILIKVYFIWIKNFYSDTSIIQYEAGKTDALYQSQYEQPQSTILSIWD